jgi:hypothetical protein
MMSSCWGTDQRKAFERIKEYISNAPVVRAPKVGEVCKLYIAAQPCVIGAVLMQEKGGKEFIIAYASIHLLDAETRYTYVEKLHLSLYYACTKFHHYILLSACMVVCHHDIIKYMLHRPILCRRVGKWAYSLVEYDLTHEPLCATKGQVAVDFIVDHMQGIEGDIVTEPPQA